MRSTFHISRQGINLNARAPGLFALLPCCREYYIHLYIRENRCWCNSKSPFQTLSESDNIKIYRQSQFHPLRAIHTNVNPSSSTVPHEGVEFNDISSASRLTTAKHIPHPDHLIGSARFIFVSKLLYMGCRSSSLLQY